MPAKIHRILQPVTPATEVAGLFTIDFVAKIFLWLAG